MEAHMLNEASATNNEATNVFPLCDDDDNVEDPQERKSAEDVLAPVDSQNTVEVVPPGPSSRDSAVQVNTPKVLTLYELITSDEKLRNFTGINNFAIFDSIVEIFEKYHKDKRVRRLSIRQRIMLLLTKFKTSLTYVTLGSLFGITPDLAKTNIYEMMPLLSKVLKPLIVFPSTTQITKNMPICFKEFQDFRVILDCTEIFVQSPKCLCWRIRFYSQYKSNITVKFMTGVSPGGLITYISKPYGGRASDKVIFEESNLISLLNPNRDAIMVDKGFVIDDICNLYKVKLIRPPFLRHKSQLSSEESILNAKIASARVHIERSNQRLKIFKILSGKLNWALVPMVEDIFIIISAITNLSSPILADTRFLSE
ncbi:uncharacterized protein LOC115883742 [Sitophilus oryzae]|uniref:Uncharacterized protein LOC115883742 n=1 Tax=Sitophilus oryzae TaxID=7048 RepID=A0A6J2Y2S8_SITOR|nr:uncharacterized protein LOC115883742 [Sitophilus oryzae]